MVYGAALDGGAITPGTALRDAPIAEYDEATNMHWKPQSGGQFRGVVLAQDAFAASLNAPAIDVFDRIGAAADHRARAPARHHDAARRGPADGARCVVREADRARARVRDRSRVAAGRSRRGSRCASVVATTSLFDAAVPEDPWLDTARRFDRIAATAGADPAERVGADGGQLLDRAHAFQLQDMMSAVVERGTRRRGTDASAVPPPARPARRTTTPTPGSSASPAALLGAVWIGFDDPTTKLGDTGDGAHAALPLWMRAMRAAEGDRPAIAVPGAPPDGMQRVAIDRETGLLAAPGSGGLGLWFRNGHRANRGVGATWYAKYRFRAGHARVLTSSATRPKSALRRS